MQNHMYNIAVMARKTASKNAKQESESFGQRLARLRKERGITQVEIAERVGIIQVLVSDYELNKLRLNAEMIVRFAAALEISTDELLKPKEESMPLQRKPSLRMLRRMEKIESLPVSQQSTLLRTIDTFLKGAAAAR
jgi:transcriptional regulator with XRE-family HTH domain